MYRDCFSWYHAAMRKIVLGGILLCTICFISCRKDSLFEINNDPGVSAEIVDQFILRLHTALNEEPKIKFSGTININIGFNAAETGFTDEVFPVLYPGKKVQWKKEDPRIVLARDIFAPAVPYYDSSMNAPVSGLTGGTYTVRPFDDIALPEKALPVEKVFPGDPDYPLILEISAVFVKDAAPGKSNREKSRNEACGKLAARLRTVYIEQETLPITWLSFVGDIMPGRGVMEILGNDGGLEKVFTNTLPLLQSSHLSIGNLEGAVTNRENKTYKSYNFKFPPSVLDYLKNAGFNYLYITNNHSFDFGIDGFKDTISNFKKAEMPTSGAGMNRAEALNPWQIRINQTDIRIISLADYPPETKFDGSGTLAGEDTPGVLWPEDDLFRIISEHNKPDTINVVCIHGGFEWRSLPAERQTVLYRKFAEAGAHLIIGTHPHILQPLEVWDNSLIAYSLGNFIFPGMDEMKYAEETVILQTGFMGNQLKYIRIYPVKINGRTAGLDETGKIAARFFKLNEEWNRMVPPGTP